MPAAARHGAVAIARGGNRKKRPGEKQSVRGGTRRRKRSTRRLRRGAAVVTVTVTMLCLQYYVEVHRRFHGPSWVLVENFLR